jgi:nucleotide-binding universal stress UspA family protein
MKTVLAPVDFSSASQQVAKEAGRYGQWTGAKVILLHVIPPPILVATYNIPVTVNTDTLERWKAAEQGMLVLEQVARAAGAHHVVGKIVKGNIVESILDEASGTAAERIVMGSHGHGAMYELLLGSTSTGVLKRATCPVLIVPIREEQKS